MTKGTKNNIYEDWTNQQLARAITIDKDQYYSEALEIMTDTLRRRGVTETSITNIEAETRIEMQRQKARRHASYKALLAKGSAVLAIIIAIPLLLLLYLRVTHKETSVLLVELNSSDTITRLGAISTLLDRNNSAASTPEIIDWLVSNTATLLDDNAKWIDSISAKSYYDVLKKLTGKTAKEPIIDSLERHLFKPQVRRRVLYLTVKVGIYGAEERLVKVLLEQGDKSMAEDFLNSGSQKLADGGRKWAEQNGYTISKGMGSHRMEWGRF
jgi:hypothetical protein